MVAYARLDATDKSDAVKTIPVSGPVLRPSYDNQDNLWIMDKADGAAPGCRSATAAATSAW